MASPRFSVVIPTREGVSTLAATLRTCLDQEFDDYEIVVCDNFSSPATREVVDGFASPRIKYLRSPRPLAMSSNWELAVAHAAGEYITVLGDDDGLLPHALRALDHLIRGQQAKVIRWDAAFYLWPNIVLPGEANYLRLPLGATVQTLEGRKVIAATIAFEQCYTTLPMLYNSIVHRDLLDSLRGRLGRLFLNRYPDVCSGYLIAYAAAEYLSVQIPMTVAGQSHKSTGIGHHFLPEKSAIGAEFLRLSSDEGVRMRPTVPDLHVFPVVPVADSFLAAKDALFPGDDSLRLDRKLVATHCVWCLRTESREQWDRCMATIRATFADDPGLQSWFDETLAGYPPSVTGPLRLRNPQMGWDGEQLHLSADAFGVNDISDAAQLCEKILGCRHADLEERFQFGGVPRAVELLNQQIRGKEAIIQQLVASVKELRDRCDRLEEKARQTISARVLQKMRDLLGQSSAPGDQRKAS
jgi:Glycosyl transferase family 2